MKILLGGASGLIGTGLVHHLAESGHEVRRLVRRRPKSPAELPWDPNAGRLDPRAMDGVDAVINLSGAGIGRPWTRHYLELLYASRLNATHTLVRAMAVLDRPPAVFISQSASGYYGDRSGDVLREDSGPGTNLLADICRKWEAAALAAPEPVRTVVTRTAVVMSPHGGVLAGLLLPLRLGIGCSLGSGKQWWPWISLNDQVRAVEFLLTANVSGPVNVCAPEAATMTELISALAAALGKNARFRVPETVVKLLLGEMGRELILASARMTPAALTRAGFSFEQATVGQLSDWVRAQLG